MADVPKSMAASASAISLPARARKREEEAELVRLAQSGEEAAFEELIRRHQQRVFGLVHGILRRREDVEDVVQQVFLKVFVSLKRFDLRAAFSTWLYKISRLDGVVSAERPPESPARRAETKDILDQLLDELPERDRELLMLKEIEGFSVQELAEMLDLNVNTVKVRLFRVRARLMDVYHRRVGPSQDHSAAKGRRKTDGSEI